MELGKHVLDKAIVDVNGYRSGKVDDLLLVPVEGGDGDWLPPLEVAALVTGPLALAQHWRPPWRWLARKIYQLLGVRDPRPLQVPWQHVEAIDVTIHLDVDRDASDLRRLSHAVARRYFARLPGA